MDIEGKGGDEWLSGFGSVASRKGATAKQVRFDVFNIPLDKLFPDSTAVVAVPILESATQSVNPTEKYVSKSTSNIIMGTKFTCRVCGCEFASLREQHEHFKSPVHVVNLKRSLARIESLKIGIVESDESDDDDDDDGYDENGYDKDDMVGPYSAAEALSEHVQHGRLSSEGAMFSEGMVQKSNDKANGSVILFRKLNSNWEFSISSAIFGMSAALDEEKEADVDPWVALRSTLLTFRGGDKLHSCVLVLQAGMFAGAVFEGGACVLHKVFRRYTVRAKAGGGQSSFDSNGRKAKSAGATLRRYGEQALREDIQALLLCWLPYLQSCVVILTAIPKTMKHYVFSDALQTGFSRDDPRIRAIPFMVKKPTFEEIKLVHQKCIRVEFNLKSLIITPRAEDGCPLDVVAEAGVEEEEEGGEEIRPRRAQRAQVDVVEEDVASPLEVVVPDDLCGLLRQLMAALSVGAGGEEEPGQQGGFSAIMQRIGAAAEERGAAADVPVWISAAHSLETLETPLHRAAQEGRSREVLALLRAGASPAAADTRSRFPYFLARDKDTRDAFRRYRGDLEEEAEAGTAKEGSKSWDWNLCGIPPGITKDMIKDKKEKEKEKKKKAKQRKQEAKLESAEQEALDRISNHEAEQVALALQERNLKLVGECGFCQKSLMGIVSLDIFDRRCCSSGCVVMLRRKLTAEAAEKRFHHTK